MSISKKRDGQIYFKILRKSIIIGLFLLPVILISFILGSAFIYLNVYNKEYSENLYVSMDEFMESDPVQLSESAWLFENLMETYSLPKNLTGDGWDYYPFVGLTFDFNPSSYGIVNDSTYMDAVNGNPLNTTHPVNKIKHYTGFGHSIVYAGYGAIGEAFRYATLQRYGNLSGLTESRNFLLKIVKGFSMLSEISDDGSMARYVYPDTEIARKYIPAHQFQEDYGGTHCFFNKTHIGPNGKEYNFYCETGTSVDCYLGAYTGLGVIYKMCNDTEIRNLIRETVDRMLTYHLNTGWRFIDEDGKTHAMGAEAVNAFPLSDSAYCATFLRVGKTVYPEKWGPIYDDFLYNRLFAKKVGKHAQWDYFKIFPWSENGGFFNVNLATSLAITLCFLEDDPYLKKYYQDHYLEPLHDGTKYFRNPWFDAGYYLGMSIPDSSSYDSLIEIPNAERISSPDKKYIKSCVADCLMRYALRKSSSRRFTHPNGKNSYTGNPNWSPIPSAPYPELETYESPNFRILENPIVKLLGSFYYPKEDMWNCSTPTDWQATTQWMWEHSPFEQNFDHGSGTEMPAPHDYTCPYWIGRYLGFDTLML
ncbi:MAG: hypothetical protein GF364_21505 [Candidatus Lokiarchaeota archaeon]|nr:hypothetical protein [Candidatus Lokiarchaeota archaeon]